MKKSRFTEEQMVTILHKTELTHRRAPWKTSESVELATLEWAAWHNHHRLMEPLGYIPPSEAEANYYKQLRNAAALNRYSLNLIPRPTKNRGPSKNEQIVTCQIT